MGVYASLLCEFNADDVTFIPKNRDILKFKYEYIYILPLKESIIIIFYFV